jgi:hypothetical protein
MPRNYSNTAVDTTLVAGIGAGDLSLIVVSATGWPAAPFAAVLDPGLATEEVVQVTAKVGTTFTVTRGFDGTAAAAHALGAVVRHAAIAGDFTDLQAADTTLQTNITTNTTAITTEASTRASADSAHAALTTTAHGGIVASTDARLTDARTPTAHASTHASAGTDPLTLAESQITGLVADLAAKQPLDSDLTAIAALTTTAYGRSYLALADAAAARTLAAAAPLAAKYIVQTADSELSAEQALGALASGYLKNTTTTGVLSVQATPIPSADLGSGTPSATTFLRGDQTWATPSGGGSGTVTSVDLTVPGVLFSVSGNPVTTAGTLALSLLTQTANTVLAGPVSGGAATPTMRALVAADIPAISLTAGVSGILPSANGGTGTNNTGNLAWPSGGGTAALLATANVFTTVNEIDRNGITGTSTDGLILANTTAATVGVQQFSPRLRLTGQGWKTTATAGSQTVDFAIETQPVQGAANPTANLVIKSQINAAGYNSVALITKDGYFLGGMLTGGGASNVVFGIDAGRGMYTGSAGTLNFAVGSTGVAQIGTNGFVTGSGLKVGWTSVTDPGTTAPDAALGRNAASIVEVNNGTAGQWGSLKAGVRDAGTTTITDGLTLGHQSTGTPAAGLGIGIQLNINSSTTADQNAARITAEWVVATHASRTARAKINVTDFNAAREVIRIEADGTKGLFSVFGAAAAGQQTGAAATATAVYTATEQAMLQKAYDVLRVFGFMI